MPSFRPLHLLLLGTALAATSALSAAREEPITVVNQSTAKYVILVQGNEGNTGELAVSLDGKSSTLKPWDSKDVEVGPRKVATVFASRDAAGKLMHTFFIRDEGYKQVKVQVASPKAADPVSVTLPSGTKLVLSGTQIVIGSPRN